jgi:hypothetical protein
MQLPEEYKENFDVSSEGPSSSLTEEGPSPAITSKVSLYFSGSCISVNLSFVNNRLTIIGTHRLKMFTVLGATIVIVIY